MSVQRVGSAACRAERTEGGVGRSFERERRTPSTMDGGEERGGGPVEQVQRHAGKVREVKVRILYYLKPEKDNLTAFLKICEVSLITAFSPGGNVWPCS